VLREEEEEGGREREKGKMREEGGREQERRKI
jgi:hypothetical protein